MKKIIKIVLLINIMIISCFGLNQISLAETKDKTIMNNMIPQSNTITKFGTKVNEGAGKGKSINVILLYFKTAIFSLFYITAVGVFIFLGIKLVMARGNAEEFKKALMGFVYAVVGIVLVPMAYVLVSFVSGINF